MSKIEQLIQEMCPDGVERVALGDVANTVSGLKGKTKADFEGGNAQFATYTNVFNNPILDISDPAYVSIRDSEKQNELHIGDVLVTGSSEVADEVGMTSAVVDLPNQNLYFNSFCFALRFENPQMILPGFSAHLFRSRRIREQIVRTANGVTRYNVSKPRFMKIQIPLPPLEVQEEIVRVLDSFLELDHELEEEIAGREKQLTELQDSFLDSGWETVRLGDLIEYSRARVKSADLNPHDYTGVENLLQDFEGRMPGDKLPPTNSVVRYEPGDVLLGNIRPYLKKAWLADAEGGASNDVLVLSIQRDSKSALLPAWLHRVITGNSFLHYNISNSKGAKMPRGDKKMILDYQIPLPPLEVQEKIATKLDTFTEYIDNLKRERELRQKQYEHYRDQLLDFKVKE